MDSKSHWDTLQHENSHTQTATLEKKSGQTEYERQQDTAIERVRERFPFSPSH